MAAKFITFEGGEGTGKTTQVQRVAHWLESQGESVLCTREPGGGELSETIRTVLMGEYDAPMPAMTELLLMFAARDAHIQQVIKPALARGSWVISDRFTDASYAYQGAARGMGQAPVAKLESLVQQDFRPDCVILFDLDPLEGLVRRGETGENNRFDNEAFEFHQKVRQAYLHRAKHNPDRYAIVDAAQDIDAVYEKICHALKQLLD